MPPLFNLGLKRIFHCPPFASTASSPLLSGFHPQRHAECLSPLLDKAKFFPVEGDEFSIGALTKGVINPAFPEYSVGGSSGGSAAFVHPAYKGREDGDGIFVSLGSDTGGSTRVPASYCQVVGFKPSYGLLSRRGMISMSDSLDTVGLMAANIQDVRQLWTEMMKRERDELDPTSVDRLSPDRAHMVDWTDVKFGVPLELFPAPLNVPDSFKSTLSLLPVKNVSSVSLPIIKDAFATYYAISAAEVSSELGRYDGIRFGADVASIPHPQNFTDATLSEYEQKKTEIRTTKLGHKVKLRIILGSWVLANKKYSNALKRKREFEESFTQKFIHDRAGNFKYHSEGVHILIHPTTHSAAPRLASVSDPMKEALQDLLVLPTSIAGLPSISIPVPNVSGQGEPPVGLCLTAQWGQDDMLLSVAESLFHVMRQE